MFSVYNISLYQVNINMFDALLWKDMQEVSRIEQIYMHLQVFILQ